jgi:hypothetical protein
LLLPVVAAYPKAATIFRNHCLCETCKWSKCGELYQVPEFEDWSSPTSGWGQRDVPEGHGVIWI